jgi:hypothetical protein
MLMKILSIAQIQLAASVVLVVASVGLHAQPDRSVQSPATSLVVGMMNARTHALNEYVQCLEEASTVSHCEPPRPLQLSVLNNAQRTQSEPLINLAAGELKKAELHAIRAHSDCVQRKRAEQCGPAP